MVPEHWLHWSWLIPGYLQEPLYDLQGEAITIIERGELNLNDGPDILNARIRVGAYIYLGDVEFHLRPEDWFRHGHQEDQRYRQVVLHGVWRLSGPLPARLAERFRHVCLAGQLALPREAWQQAMEMLEGHLEAPAGEGARAVPGAEDLAQLSLVRLQRKTARFARWAEAMPLGEVFWRGVAEALGYTRNARPMAALMAAGSLAQLAGLLPRGWPRPLALWVHLLIRAGLWTALARHRFREGAPALRLAAWYLGQGVVPALQLTDWHFARLRPGNHPLVRLAALAQLLASRPRFNLFAEFLARAVQRPRPAQLLQAWQQLLLQPLSPSLHQALQTLLGWPHLPTRPLGRQRARQILLNVVLPLLLLWARRTGNPGFALYLEGLYETFPGCEDPALFQHRRWPALPRDLQSRLRQSAFLQQGFLEWLHLQRPGFSPALCLHPKGGSSVSN